MKTYTELTFERVVRYLQCRGIYLTDGMIDKDFGAIFFNHSFDDAGSLIRCFMVGFPEGGHKRGTQIIDFCVTSSVNYGPYYLVKSFCCEDILSFAREFEYFNCVKQDIEHNEDFSYLYEEECQLPQSLDENEDLVFSSENMNKQPDTEEIFEREYCTVLNEALNILADD